MLPSRWFADFFCQGGPLFPDLQKTDAGFEFARNNIRALFAHLSLPACPSASFFGAFFSTYAQSWCWFVSVKFSFVLAHDLVSPASVNSLAGADSGFEGTLGLAECCQRAGPDNDLN